MLSAPPSLKYEMALPRRWVSQPHVQFSKMHSVIEWMFQIKRHEAQNPSFGKCRIFMKRSLGKTQMRTLYQKYFTCEVPQCQGKKRKGKEKIPLFLDCRGVFYYNRHRK